MTARRRRDGNRDVIEVGAAFGCIATDCKFTAPAVALRCHPSFHSAAVLYPRHCEASFLKKKKVEKAKQGEITEEA